MSLGILVVEDDTDARETLVLLLTAFGHRARGECDVASARAAIDEGSFDLLLVDYTLPDGSGADVARAVGGVGQASRPLVVGLTGWSASHLSAEERSLFDRVAQKPIRSEQLKELLSEAERRRAAAPRSPA